MNSWNLRNFRNDLSIFLNLISNKYPITGDFSKLWDLTGKLHHKFKYDLQPIVFKINGSISGSNPYNLKRHIIYFENSISINDDLQENKDSLQNYKFELNMDSYLSLDEDEDEDGNETKQYKSAWHHDKHDENEETKYSHPSYHFHFGGRYLKGLETGDISVMSCPRIPHPPMDIFLGFHFVISNFFSLKEYPIVSELKSNYEYQNIIKRAQERLWKPYFKAFDSTNIHQDFTINKIFPLYLS